MIESGLLLDVDASTLNQLQSQLQSCLSNKHESASNSNIKELEDSFDSIDINSEEELQFNFDVATNSPTKDFMADNKQIMAKLRSLKKKLTQIQQLEEKKVQVVQSMPGIFLNAIIKGIALTLEQNKKIQLKEQIEQEILSLRSMVDIEELERNSKEKSNNKKEWKKIQRKNSNSKEDVTLSKSADDSRRSSSISSANKESMPANRESPRNIPEKREIPESFPSSPSPSKWGEKFSGWGTQRSPTKSLLEIQKEEESIRKAAQKPRSHSQPYWNAHAKPTNTNNVTRTNNMTTSMGSKNSKENIQKEESIDISNSRRHRSSPWQQSIEERVDKSKTKSLRELLQEQDKLLLDTKKKEKSPAKSLAQIQLEEESLNAANMTEEEQIQLALKLSLYSSASA
jgi:hypothetical protein